MSATVYSPCEALLGIPCHTQCVSFSKQFECKNKLTKQTEHSVMGVPLYLLFLKNLSIKSGLKS